MNVSFFDGSSDQVSTVPCPIDIAYAYGVSLHRAYGTSNAAYEGSNLWGVPETVTKHIRGATSLSGWRRIARVHTMRVL